ncbi:hypothetical protein [Kribbella sp. NPDC003557]|uniref:hypothetical protein n=1 Tax=Kribbella sp. NPDC003557 TaxID=3154449 RepID=UPI0033AD5E1A
MRADDNSWNPVVKPPDPKLDDDCEQPLEAWGVTRRFDFGQFVLLQQEGKLNGKTTSMPLVVSEGGSVYGEGEDPDDDDRRPRIRAAATIGAGGPLQGEPLPRGSLAEAFGGVPLDIAYVAGDEALELVTARPGAVPVADISAVVAGDPVEINGREVRPRLGVEEVSALWGGRSVTVVATDADGGDPTVVRLMPKVTAVDLDADAVDAVLAGREVGVAGGGVVTIPPTPEVAQALLANRSVVAPGLFQDKAQPFRLTPRSGIRGAGDQPAARRFVIADAPGFFASPMVPSLDGRPIQVPMTADLAAGLRRDGSVLTDINGRDVRLVLGPEAVTNPGRGQGTSVILNWPGLGHEPIEELELTYDFFHSPYGEGLKHLGGLQGGGESGTEVVPEKKAAIPRPKGLRVAVFLPWRQEWKLVGFSRGNLISSIALAPGEEVTIRVSQWERRSKALEQMSETETDITADFTSTTRDTEDVFREMTSSQEFQAQASASLDASYSPGVASIQVAVDGSITSGNNVGSIARSSQQHMQETVRRATTRVRSRRVTKITEQVEAGRSEDVVRHIRNPNSCNTLTLDYHERLAHYTVTTKFLPQRVRVVVMIENPLGSTEFTGLLVRTNETALRNALLNPELADAFEAVRLLRSYEFAWDEAASIAAKSKEVAELDRQRAKQQQGAGSGQQDEKPDPPQLKDVLAALAELRKASDLLVKGDYKPAFGDIADRSDHRATPDHAQSAQRWLFRTLVQNKVSASLVAKMREIGSATLSVEYARTFADALPSTAYPGLTDLAGLKDTDKEDAGLAAAIKEHYGWFGNWGWFTGQVRDQGMYSPDDCGFAAAHRRLTQALRDYEAKASEGDALLTQQQMVAGANQEQAAANWVDKLEMKYGLEVVADAHEREEALLAHLKDHADYYRFVLFQALPPGEQLKLLTDLAPQLRVGFFEPRVVANNGSLLALPLTPVGESQLVKTVEDLKTILEKASDEAAQAEERMQADDYILPTPGMTVTTTLGVCDGCGPHERAMHDIEKRKAAAEAGIAEAEVRRRGLRLDDEQYDDPVAPPRPLRIELITHEVEPAVDPVP